MTFSFENTEYQICGTGPIANLPWMGTIEDEKPSEINSIAHQTSRQMPEPQKKKSLISEILSQSDAFHQAFTDIYQNTHQRTNRMNALADEIEQIQESTQAYLLTLNQANFPAPPESMSDSEKYRQRLTQFFIPDSKTAPQSMNELIKLLVDYHTLSFQQKDAEAAYVASLETIIAQGLAKQTPDTVITDALSTTPPVNKQSSIRQ